MRDMTQVNELNNYDNRLDQFYEELTNEIMYDLDSAVQDYPKNYIALMGVDENNQDNITVIHYPYTDSDISTIENNQQIDQ